MNIENLTHFFEFNARIISDFLYVIKYKKRNIKPTFEKIMLNLLNMRRKINRRGKDKVIHGIGKIEKMEQFSGPAGWGSANCISAEG